MFIFDIVVCIITFIACQDLASRMNISQITFFFCVFSGKKTLTHGGKKIDIDN
jgi:hypothetical protein